MVNGLHLTPHSVTLTRGVKLQRRGGGDDLNGSFSVQVASRDDLVVARTETHDNSASNFSFYRHTD